MKYIASTRPTVRKKSVVQSALRLGLTRHPGDQGATGKTVTDRGADGASAEREPAADEAAREFDGLGRYVDGHFSPQFR